MNLLKNSVAAKKQEELIQQQVLNSLSSQLNDNFWVAYDALEPKNYSPLVTKGIHLAKELQKAIISVGTDILERVIAERREWAHEHKKKTGKAPEDVKGFYERFEAENALSPEEEALRKQEEEEY